MCHSNKIQPVCLTKSLYHHYPTNIAYLKSISQLKSELHPQDGTENQLALSIDMEQNYITVILCNIFCDFTNLKTSVHGDSTDG